MNLLHSLKKYLAPYFPIFKVIFAALAAFTFYRLCFMFFNRELIPSDTHDTAFLYFRAWTLGWNFDIVITFYLISPFLLFLFIREQFKLQGKTAFAFFKWYFAITFCICFLICAADIPFYKQFGNHLNKGFLVWTESPGFVLHLIFSNVSYWGYLLLFIVLNVFFFRCLTLIFRSTGLSTEIRLRSRSILTFLLLALGTFIGIRGRTAFKSPIRIGTAVFSEYTFFNQLGLNPCFTFIHSLTEHSKEWDFLNTDYSTADLDKVKKNIAPESKSATTGFERSYRFDSVPKNYNVVIVLMESMSVSKMGYYNYPDLTKSFDSIASNGVFFDHFFSAGIHTFNGLFSSETGFPAIMDIHPLNTYVEKPFKGISYWLKKQGYSNYFFTSHDPQFDNMEAFFLSNNFDRVFSEYDFPVTKSHGPLGLPDHYLLDVSLKKMDEHVKQKKTPFFSYIMTSSDHGPWDLPSDIPFEPSADNKQDRATQYADWSLGNFIRKAKQYDWFNNTLFVFAGDHGGNLGNTYSMPLSYNHIPCVFYMPSQLKSDTVHSLGGQIDIYPTLLSYLKVPFDNGSMGIDLMKEKRPYMYFTADSKIGCIDTKNYYIHLLNEQEELFYEYKDLNTHNYYEERRSKADSMKNYALEMLRTSNYLLKNKLY